MTQEQIIASRPALWLNLDLLTVSYFTTILLTTNDGFNDLQVTSYGPVVEKWLIVRIRS